MRAVEHFTRAQYLLQKRPEEDVETLKEFDRLRAEYVAMASAHSLLALTALLVETGVYGAAGWGSDWNSALGQEVSGP